MAHHTITATAIITTQINTSMNNPSYALLARTTVPCALTAVRTIALNRSDIHFASSKPVTASAFSPPTHTAIFCHSQVHACFLVTLGTFHHQYFLPCNAGLVLLYSIFV